MEINLVNEINLHLNKMIYILLIGHKTMLSLMMIIEE